MILIFTINKFNLIHFITYSLFCFIILSFCFCIFLCFKNLNNYFEFYSVIDINHPFLEQKNFLFIGKKIWHYFNQSDIMKIDIENLKKEK